MNVVTEGKAVFDRKKRPLFKEVKVGYFGYVIVF